MYHQDVGRLRINGKVGGSKRCKGEYLPVSKYNSEYWNKKNLLARIATGEATSRDEFRHEFYHYVKWVVRRYCVPCASSLDVEDCVPAVFLQFFQQVEEKAEIIKNGGFIIREKPRHALCRLLDTAMCSTLSDMLSDKDLLCFFARWKDDDSTRFLADKAFVEFDRRHRPYLMYFCGIYTSGIFDKMQVEQLVQEVFLKVSLKAHTYKDNGLKDHLELRRLTRGWLAEIARNCYIDMLRRRVSVEEEHIEDERDLDIPCRESDPSTTSAEEEFTSQDVMRLREAMKTVLNKKERIILQITFDYYENRDEKEKTLKKLAEALAITPTNLRSIRSRAIKKLKKYMS